MEVQSNIQVSMTSVSSILQNEIQKYCGSISKCKRPLPKFVASHDDAKDQLSICFAKLLDGVDVNLVLLNKLLQMCAYQDVSDVYNVYCVCLSNKITSVYKELESVSKDKENKQMLFNCLNNYMAQLITNCKTINKILSDCDYNYNLATSFNKNNNVHKFSEFVNSVNFITLFSQTIDGCSLLKKFDDNIGEDMHNLQAVSDIISSMKSINESDMISFTRQLKNTKVLFLKNIDRLQYDVCVPFIEMFGRDNTFIKMYRVYLVDRLIKQRCKDALLHERKIISLLKPFDEVDRKCIDRMYGQIDDSINSLGLTDIFAHKTNIVVESETFRDVPIDKEICKFNVIDKYMWDVSDPSSYINLPKEMEVYSLIFKKIYGIDNKHNELLIDPHKSTGILNIVINDNPYNFLVTFQQMNVLIRIINATSITYSKLLEESGIKPAEDLDTVLDSLYACELVNCDDDTYTINENFFFKESDISLLNTLEYKEKFDELHVVDIIDIITKTPNQTIADVFNCFVTSHGVTNYELIESTMKYLEKKNIIIFDGTVYKLNDSIISELDNTLVSV